MGYGGRPALSNAAWPPQSSTALWRKDEKSCSGGAASSGLSSRANAGNHQDSIFKKHSRHRPELGFIEMAGAGTCQGSQGRGTGDTGDESAGRADPMSMAPHLLLASTCSGPNSMLSPGGPATWAMTAPRAGTGSTSSSLLREEGKEERRLNTVGTGVARQTVSSISPKL